MENSAKRSDLSTTQGDFLLLTILLRQANDQLLLTMAVSVRNDVDEVSTVVAKGDSSLLVTLTFNGDACVFGTHDL